MMVIDALAWIAGHLDQFLAALQQHLIMSVAALAAGLAIGIPLAVLILANRTAAFLVTNAISALRTVPSLAILAAALPFLGIGLLPSILALVLLAVPPILLNSYVGLRAVDPDIADAALGMGMTRIQIVRDILIPLAAPSIFAGTRTATVQVLAGATLASFIGGGGLGDFITAGIAIMDFPRLLVGALPIALLAVGAEAGFARLERRLFRHLAPQADRAAVPPVITSAVNSAANSAEGTGG